MSKRKSAAQSFSSLNCSCHPQQIPSPRLPHPRCLQRCPPHCGTLRQHCAASWVKALRAVAAQPWPRGQLRALAPPRWRRSPGRRGSCAPTRRPGRLTLRLAPHVQQKWQRLGTCSAARTACCARCLWGCHARMRLRARTSPAATQAHNGRRHALGRVLVTAPHGSASGQHRRCTCTWYRRRAVILPAACHACRGGGAGEAREGERGG
jgi:hypothetical protein